MKTVKRILGLLLAVVMLVCSAPLVLAKNEKLKEGYYTYSVENNQAIILNCDKTIAGSVFIPDTLGGYPVTTIWHVAFSECTELTEITMGENLTYLGERAFYGCKSLKNINFGNNITDIEVCAFQSCTGLENLVLPNSITHIGSEAFGNCISLTSVTIPKSMTYISGTMFYRCSKLKNVVIPEGITEIFPAAFCGCTNLTAISIPNSVTTIRTGAFADCGLTEITVPKSVKEIEPMALGYIVDGKTEEEVEKVKDFTIYGYTNSVAETYAKENGFNFVALDDTPTTNCSHICHKGGISKLFYKIALFFWKMFKTNKNCSCGAAHY